MEGLGCLSAACSKKCVNVSVSLLLKCRAGCIFINGDEMIRKYSPQRESLEPHRTNILMRYSLVALSVFAALCAVMGRGDDLLPARANFNRYSAMVDHSPFAVATTVALPAATPNFAKDLYVANVAHSPDGDIATIASSSDHSFKKYLTTREPVDGYRIVRIEWSDRVGVTKVTVSKDGNLATLTFNEALLSQRAAPNVPPVPVQVAPSVPVMPSSMAVQAPVGGVPAILEHKPGAPPLDPQQELQQQQQRAQRQQRQTEKKWELSRQRQPDSRRP